MFSYTIYIYTPILIYLFNYRVYNKQCVQCTLYTVQYSSYSVQCTLYSAQCTLCTVVHQYHNVNIHIYTALDTRKLRTFSA